MLKKLRSEWASVLGIGFLILGCVKMFAPSASARIRSGIGSQYYLDFYATNRVGMRVLWLTNISATGFVYTAKQVPYFVW